MKIEVGQEYITRRGGRARVTGYSKRTGLYYVSPIHGGDVWAARPDGAARNGDLNNDLVTPYLDVKNPEGYGKTETGAQRQSIGTKIDTSLVPYELVVGAAMGLNYGADKYAPRNFEKGLSYSSLLGSIERHNRAIMDGEEIDDDSGLPHWALLCSSVAMMVHNIMQGVIVDDRAEAKQGAYIGELAEMAQRLSDEAQRRRNPAHVAEGLAPDVSSREIRDLITKVMGDTQKGAGPSSDDTAAHEALCGFDQGYNPLDLRIPFLDFMSDHRKNLDAFSTNHLDNRLQQGVELSGKLTKQIEEAQKHIDNLRVGQQPYQEAIGVRDGLLSDRREVDDYCDLLGRVLDRKT